MLAVREIERSQKHRGNGEGTCELCLCTGPTWHDLWATLTFYDFSSINKTHSVITKACIYSQSYAEIIVPNDTLDLWQTHLRGLSVVPGSLTRKKSASAAWSCLPSYPPPPHHPITGHLKSFRDIHVNLAFNSPPSI